MKSGLSVLETILPSDSGQKIVLHHLSVEDCVNLKQTNVNLSQFFNKRPPHFWISKLAYHLAQAPDDKWVQFIIKNNPNLIDVVFDKVVLKSCTIFNVTPFQLAYSGKDNGMCEKLLPFFIKKYGIERSNEEIQKQIQEMKNYHKPFDFTPIIQAISNELFNTGYNDQTKQLKLSKATLAAIETFNYDFDENQPKIIEKGMQFRWETFQELIDAYAKVAEQWEYDYNKCALFEDAVFSWVLSYLPENGKQWCNQGIYYLVKDDPDPFIRMQKMRDNKNIDEVLKQRSTDFHLNGFCPDIIFGHAGERWGELRFNRIWRRELKNLQSFCQTKTSNFLNLSSNRENQIYNSGP